MIYEASSGETVNQAAREAVIRKCDKFVHNDWLYSVDVAYSKVGILKLDPKPAPAQQIEFGGQTKP